MTSTRAAADGTTALIWAAYNGDAELAERLIAAGADLDVKNEFGTSALSEAAIGGYTDVIAALLARGAEPNLANPEGETPLMAVARTGNVEAAKLLLDAGADVNAIELWGQQSALMWAAAQRQPAMMKLSDRARRSTSTRVAPCAIGSARSSASRARRT